MKTKSDNTDLIYTNPELNLYREPSSILATRADIEKLSDKMDEHFGGEKRYGKRLLTPSKMYLNKQERMRATILLISCLFAGVFATCVLVFWNDTILRFFFLSVLFPAMGTTLTSFLSLLKGKAYDNENLQ